MSKTSRWIPFVVVLVLVEAGAAPVGEAAAPRTLQPTIREIQPPPSSRPTPATQPACSETGETRTAPAPPARNEITAGKAAILGVVEGITEYLPVSSTGHLILAGHYMGLTHFSDRVGPFGRMLDRERMKAIDAFAIVIQLGAILAVLGLYRRRVGQMCLGLVGRSHDGIHLFAVLLVAFLPAAVVGKLFHHKIEEYLFGPVPVALALGVGGVLMIVVEHFFWRRRRNSPRVGDVAKVLFWQGLVIGLAQCLAMWPGTSRSMITILAGLVVGLDMMAAAEFSFLLALPTLSAATIYSAWKDWGALREAAGIDGLLIGLVVSGVVAAIAVKGFVAWLTRHGLLPFGVYRILLAIALLIIL
jgi:undecaprenyl-diphosphatase